MQGAVCLRKQSLSLTYHMQQQETDSQLNPQIVKIPALISEIPISFRKVGGFGGGIKGWLGSWTLGPGPVGHVMSGKLTGMLKP